MSSLYYAALRGRNEIVHLLIKAKADPNLQRKVCLLMLQLAMLIYR